MPPILTSNLWSVCPGLSQNANLRQSTAEDDCVNLNHSVSSPSSAPSVLPKVTDKQAKGFLFQSSGMCSLWAVLSLTSPSLLPLCACSWLPQSQLELQAGICVPTNSNFSDGFRVQHPHGPKFTHFIRWKWLYVQILLLVSVIKNWKTRWVSHYTGLWEPSSYGEDISENRARDTGYTSKHFGAQFQEQSINFKIIPLYFNCKTNKPYRKVQCKKRQQPNNISGLNQSHNDGNDNPEVNKHLFTKYSLERETSFLEFLRTWKRKRWSRDRRDVTEQSRS